jgi:hypothetical protein
MENDHPSEIPDESRTAEQIDAQWREYLFFREEMRHEDNLVNQRVSWLIGSQAFLLGGFATLISAASTVPVSSLDKIRGAMVVGLPIAGILGVVANYVTILAAVWHVAGLKKFMKNRTPVGMPPLKDWHVIQRGMGVFGPLTTPLIFLTFWNVILVKLR